jgi:probable O-glycosylation ligase (exosortase A-associated)
MLRSLAVALIVFVGLGFTIKRPYYGMLLWVWLALMNPHRLSYGFAYSYPFAELVGLVTLGAFVLSKEPKLPPLTRTTCLLIAFTIWVNFTTPFALDENAAYSDWLKVNKIFFANFLLLTLLTSGDRLKGLGWVIALSLGYFGIRNGLASAMSGASYRVSGPPDTQLTDNNNYGTASVMVLPIMWYLQLQTRQKFLRLGLIGAAGLTSLAALATYSRGAFLAIGAVGGNLWLKSRHKLGIGIVLVVLGLVFYNFMPAQWFSRINSIETYQEDTSVTGRFDAWHHAVTVALARPFTGGGNGNFSAKVFAMYSPGVFPHAAHSIYFQVLGEQGWIGLTLFLGIWITAFRDGSWVIKRTRDVPELKWARDLAAMLQLSMIGYAVGGAFLSLVYLDFYYMIIAMMIATRAIVAKQVAPEPKVEVSVRARAGRSAPPLRPPGGKAPIPAVRAGAPSGLSARPAARRLTP